MLKRPALPKEARRKVIKDFAKAYSLQSKYSNRLWLAAITAAAVIVFPREIDKKSEKLIELPFSLATVPLDQFHVLGFFILTIITTTYFVAYAQAQNAAFFLQRALGESERSAARIFYDLSITSSLQRVGPLVDRFYFQMEMVRLPHKHKITASYYAILKLLVTLIVFGLPAVAVIFAYSKLYMQLADPYTSLIFWLATFALAVVGVIGAKIFIADVIWIKDRTIQYWKGKLPTRR